MTSSQRSTRRSSTRLLEREEALLNGHGGADTAGRQQANGKVSNVAASKKRKSDYDEEDDGFMFTRTRSKRAKAGQAAPQPETIVEERQEPVHVQVKARKNRSSDTPSAPDKEDRGLKVRKKRSARTSGDKRPVGKEEENEQERAKGGRRAEGRDDAKKSQPRPIEESSEAAQRGGQPEDITDLVGGVSHVEKSRDATKIALPFADTPVIRRNKEMRKGADTGHRRSSLGMRGRRASSLIDGGKSNGRRWISDTVEGSGSVADGREALPHDEVDTADFYKHIESDGLPEPRRMKQLLTWCGTRAMGEKPGFSSEDSNARLAARVIQEELLKDFSTRSEMSDWFNREETAPVTLVKKPNPKNVSNAERIQDLEAQIKRLQEERKTWEDLLKPPKAKDNDKETKDAPSIPLSTSNLTSTSNHPPPPSLPTFDTTFLSPEQLSILETLSSPGPIHPIPTTLTIPPPSSSTTTATTSRMRFITSNIEPTIDAFADGIHKLAQFTDTADRVASKVLATAAEVLDEKDREGRRRGETEGVGVGRVLRGLSRFEG